MDLDGSFGYITKRRLLFAVPLSEPDEARRASTDLWKRTSESRCWTAVGPYRLAGLVHTEEGRNPQIALRSLDKQFVPLTDVTITRADGTTLSYSVVLLNRDVLDILVLRE
jgi:hypothetical protein